LPRKAARQPAPKSLRPRIESALREGRLPQALELARQQYTQAPTTENAELLRDVLLRGARGYVERDAPADARRWLDDAEKVEGPPAWWEALALLRARLGDGEKAKQLLAKAPGSPVAGRVAGQLADRALLDKVRGRPHVPAEFTAGLDAVLAAFAFYAKGEDEQAREALQAIGLQSPFLDWKLLLRGLMAYSANEDQRALENWQRLDPDRLPARLAAPLRALIDPSGGAALDGEQAKKVARRADALGHPMLAPLRDLQRTLASPEGLPKALRQASSLVGLMRTNFPHLVPKLANCFYWLIIQGGQPEDLGQYERLFGAPPDDRHFTRLQALVMESYPQLEAAHKSWQEYLREIETAPDRWPGEQGRRARAMILLRMGDNALEHEEGDDGDIDELAELFGMGRRRGAAPEKRKPLVPTAETCYRQALELAPGWREPAARLLDLLQDAEKWPEAEDVGRRALELHPDDVKLLLDLSNVQQAQGKMDEALGSLKRALKNNPLDRVLRTGVAVLDVQAGRALTLAKQYDAARASFAEALQLEPDAVGPVARAAWAACETKAGDTARAGQLAAELPAAPPHGLASAYYLFVEFNRAKVAKPTLKPRQEAFEQALAAGPSVAELLPLALAMSFYRNERPPYRGLGTHEKKLLALLLAAVDAKPPEDQLEKLGWVSLGQNYTKVLKAVGEQGQKRFPKSPAFAYFRAEQLILQRPKSFREYDVGRLFREVMEKTEGRHDDRSRMMRDAVEERVRQYPDLEYWVRPGKALNIFDW
jgi:tetratricopeptide (TPR) repeat protein